jgi:hypothetical protein
MAVWMAAPPVELDDVAPAAALEAPDLALETTPVTEAPTLLAWDEREDSALEIEAETDAAAEEALAPTDSALDVALPPGPPKMVVEPMVVVMVLEPEVSTETIAEVVIAELPPPRLDPPAAGTE